ncbi:hypothetical protein C8J57DRAFT_151269 [Mycena rebaudengoi]|nr:hypothetical protein C8J57DRAFT_151269 [Mycena rebaudengoi]
MNYLCAQGISLASLGAENFDVFLDIDDRFLISINPPTSPDAGFPDDQQPEDNTTRSWDVFNALCQKVLRSANRLLHNENIERNPVVLDLSYRPSVTQKSWTPFPPSSLPSHESLSPEIQEAAPPVPPRREYVWRTIDRGRQSLATVASQITLALDMKPVNKLALIDGRSAHRCAGYVREEITLAPTTHDSAVVSHDAPSPLEICSVCNEVVGLHELFRCICGDPNPGSHSTVKCQVCKFWSHSACVGNPKEFNCRLCSGGLNFERVFGHSSSSPSSSASSPDGGSRRSSPVHAASLVDPSMHSHELLQLVDIKLSKPVIEYVVDCVSETVDYAMGRADAPHGTPRSPYHAKFTSFVSTVLARAEVSPATILTSLVYVVRARPHMHIALEEWALERVFLGALICASKYRTT